MPYSNPNVVAGGTIGPCLFVTLSQTTEVDFTVVQATDGTSSHGDNIFGVSQEGTENWNSANAATVGGQLRVFGPGETCMILCGGTVTAGDPLKSDANGKAIVSGTTGTGIPSASDMIGGVALQSGTSGTKIQIQIKPYVA